MTRPKIHPNAHIGWVTRFKIYQYVRGIMEAENRCPTGVDVVAKVGISQGVAQNHLAKLANADGLPFQIPDGMARRSISHHAAGRSFDPDIALPVDAVINKLEDVK